MLKSVGDLEFNYTKCKFEWGTKQRWDVPGFEVTCFLS